MLNVDKCKLIISLTFPIWSECYYFCKFRMMTSFCLHAAAESCCTTSVLYVKLQLIWDPSVSQVCIIVFMQLITQFSFMFIMITVHFDNLEIYSWVVYSVNLFPAISNMCSVSCKLIGLLGMQSYFVFFCHSHA